MKRRIPKYVVYSQYDADGNLLYVGQSSNIFQRIQTWNQCIWFKQIANITLEHCEGRAEALTLEAEKIRNESPRFNSAHNDGRREDPAEYLRERIKK